MVHRYSPYNNHKRNFVVESDSDITGGLQAPTYVSFHILFDFHTSGTDETLSKELILNGYDPLNDLMMDGLLLGKDVPYSAERVLEKHTNHLQYLIDFKNLLNLLQREAPWEFQEVENLKLLWMENFHKEGEFDPSRHYGKEIIIECLEDRGWKMHMLADLYRNLSFDHRWQTQLLNINSRRFSCKIIIHELREFNSISSSISNSVSRTGSPFNNPDYGKYSGFNKNKTFNDNQSSGNVTPTVSLNSSNSNVFVGQTSEEPSNTKKAIDSEAGVMSNPLGALSGNTFMNTLVSQVARQAASAVNRAGQNALTNLGAAAQQRISGAIQNPTLRNLSEKAVDLAQNGLSSVIDSKLNPDTAGNIFGEISKGLGSSALQNIFGGQRNGGVSLVEEDVNNDDEIVVIKNRNNGQSAINQLLVFELKNCEFIFDDLDLAEQLSVKSEKVKEAKKFKFKIKVGRVHQTSLYGVYGINVQDVHKLQGDGAEEKVVDNDDKVYPLIDNPAGRFSLMHDKIFPENRQLTQDRSEKEDRKKLDSNFLISAVEGLILDAASSLVGVLVAEPVNGLADSLLDLDIGITKEQVSIAELDHKIEKAEPEEIILGDKNYQKKGEGEQIVENPILDKKGIVNTKGIDNSYLGIDKNDQSVAVLQGEDETSLQNKPKIEKTQSDLGPIKTGKTTVDDTIDKNDYTTTQSPAIPQLNKKGLVQENADQAYLGKDRTTQLVDTLPGSYDTNALQTPADRQLPKNSDIANLGKDRTTQNVVAVDGEDTNALQDPAENIKPNLDHSLSHEYSDVDLSHSLSHQIDTVDLSHELTHQIDTVDLSHELTHQIDTVDLSHELSHQIDTVDLSHELTHQLDTVDLSHELSHQIDTVDLSHELTHQIDTVDLSHELTHQLDTVDLNHELSHQIDTVDLSHELTHQLDTVDLSHSLSHQIDTVDLGNEITRPELGEVDLSSELNTNNNGQVGESVSLDNKLEISEINTNLSPEGSLDGLLQSELTKIDLKHSLSSELGKLGLEHNILPSEPDKVELKNTLNSDGTQRINLEEVLVMPELNSDLKNTNLETPKKEALNVSNVNLVPELDKVKLDNSISSEKIDGLKLNNEINSPELKNDLKLESNNFLTTVETINSPNLSNDISLSEITVPTLDSEISFDTNLNKDLSNFELNSPNRNSINFDLNIETPNIEISTNLNNSIETNKENLVNLDNKLNKESTNSDSLKGELQNLSTIKPELGNETIISKPEKIELQSNLERAQLLNIDTKNEENIPSIIETTMSNSLDSPSIQTTNTDNSILKPEIPKTSYEAKLEMLKNRTELNSRDISISKSEITNNPSLDNSIEPNFSPKTISKPTESGVDANNYKQPYNILNK